MKGKSAVILAVGVLWLVISAAALGVSISYDSSWWTVDGGGGPGSGEAYVLDGTIGQPDAGAMTGGRFSLSGGYWGSQSARSVHLPVILR